MISVSSVLLSSTNETEAPPICQSRLLPLDVVSEVAAAVPAAAQIMRLTDHNQHYQPVTL